ncbi:ribosome maturation factor RimM [soil metagenome]
MASVLPADLVVVARVEDAFGIRGAIRVVPFGDADALLKVDRWWIGPQEGAAKSYRMTDAKRHGPVLVAQLDGMADRNLAEALRGQQVSLERSRFPALDEDEQYWVDLIGCDVLDVDGQPRGKVVELTENGAHSILHVLTSGGSTELVPYVDAYVRDTDMAERRVVLDWAWE